MLNHVEIKQQILNFIGKQPLIDPIKLVSNYTQIGKLDQSEVLSIRLDLFTSLNQYIIIASGDEKLSCTLMQRKKNHGEDQNRFSTIFAGNLKEEDWFKLMNIIVFCEIEFIDIENIFDKGIKIREEHLKKQNAQKENEQQ